MKNNWLKGVGVALVTPFNSSFGIDIDSYRKIIDHVISGGVDFLVVLGTTGESVTLNAEEKQMLIRKTVEFASGRVPVVAGFGGNDTRKIIKHIENYDLAGVSALLSVSPSYNKPTQEGIYQHYKMICGSTDLPIILYNVPSRTSSNIDAETTLRLARDFKNIIAIKEATYDLGQITYLAMNKPDGFYLLSGADDLIFHEMGLGFDGVISVIANALPKQFTHMIELCRKDRFLQAGRIHLDLYDLISMLFVQGNPAGVKCALEHLGICEPHVRLPLAQVDAALKREISKEVDRITRQQVKLSGIV